MKSLILLLLTLSCLNVASQSKPYSIHLEDIDRFWETLSLYEQDQNHKIFQEYYLQPGTPGLRQFIKGRINSSKNLAYTVASKYPYYKQLQESTDQLPKLTSQIETIYDRAQELYPYLKVPDVYFVIGALNSGGTSSDQGIIIGCDMFGLQDSTDKNLLGQWLADVIKPIDQVPLIVAHEMIHYQQRIEPNTLLAASIMEGSADFLGELISGGHINSHIHDFALPREQEIWKEFEKGMHKKSTKGWIYSGKTGWPNDVGYFVGYRIAEAYYRRMEDKKQAIEDIMEVENAELFLEQSGYGQFE